MTRKELSEEFNISESSIKTNFPKVQESIFRKHKIRIVKTGRGEKADYQLIYAIDSDGRAQSAFKEKNRNLMLAKSEFSSLVDFNFMVFLGICATPMTTFYGSYKEFLKYVEVKVSDANVSSLVEALQLLNERGLIEYVIDKTNSDYFWAGLYHKTREDMYITIDMMERCKQLAKKYNKKSWVNLLKTWVGVQYLYDNQPFTVSELSVVTGLSAYQLKQNKKILQTDDLFVTTRAYAAYDRCIGSNVELNGIYDENREFVKTLAETAKK